MLTFTRIPYILKAEPQIFVQPFSLNYTAVSAPAKISVPIPPKPQQKEKPKAVAPKWIEYGDMYSTEISFYEEGNAVAWSNPAYRNYQSYCWDKAVVAHRSLKFGTKVRIFYKDRSVDAIVVDRGPFVGGRDLDLSPGAMMMLAPQSMTSAAQRKAWMIERGVLHVQWCKLKLQ